MAERLLNDEIARQVRDLFQQLEHPVQVLYFGDQEDCETCEDTLKLAQEVVDLSDKLALSVHDIEADSALAGQYHVDKTPSLVIAGKDGANLVDYGVRFSGIPSGHEFASLVHSLVLVSSRDSGLSPQTRQALQSLKKPIHLQVFVTPT